MFRRMFQRRDTGANWTSRNPILGAGEICFEIDTQPWKSKIGDGIARWNDLPYQNALNAAAIATEASARAAADSAEASARAAGDAAEVTARTNAVNAEASTRAAADSAEITARTNAVNSEASTRAAADSAEATARAAAVTGEASTRAAADTAEASARAAADVGLGDRIDTEVTDRAAAVSAEASTRATADSAEVTARTNAVSAEASARAAADSTEASTRAAADDALSDRIDTEVSDRATGDSDEAAARAAADSAEVTARTNAVSAEASSRAAADSAEASTRAAADSALSDRVDAADDDLDAHEAASTNVHGIVSVADLETLSGAQTVTGLKTHQPVSPSSVGFIVKGAAAQSAALQQWRNSADTTLTWVDSAGKLNVTDGNAPAAALLTTDYIVISAEASAPGFSIVSAGTGVGQRGVFKAVRSRGTLATPTVPLLDDNVLSVLGSIYDGVTTQGTAAVTMLVDGTVSSGVAPQRIGFFTSTTDAASRTERMTIKSAGNVGIGVTSPSAHLDVRPNIDRVVLQVRPVSGGTSSLIYGVGDSGSLVFEVGAKGRVGVLAAANASQALAVGNGSAHPDTGTSLKGVHVDVTYPSTTTVFSADFYSQTRTAAAAFTLADSRGVHIDTPVLGAGSAITTRRGVHINSQATAGISTSYGVVVVSGSSYAARLDGGTTANLFLNSDNNAIAGGVAFGTAADTPMYRSAAGVVSVSSLRAQSRIGVLVDPEAAKALSVGGSNAHPGTATTLYGIDSDVTYPSTTTGNAIGLQARIRTAATSFTLANAAALQAAGPIVGSGSAVTTATGVNVFSQAASGVTTSYGALIASGSSYAARVDGGTTANLWLNSDTASILGGVALGTARDVGLFRHAASRLRTSADFIAGTVTAGTTGQDTGTIILAGGGSNHPSSATSIAGVTSNHTAPSTATSNSFAYRGVVATAAASFTLATAYTFKSDAPTMGSGSAITNLAAFRADAQAGTGVATSHGFWAASGSTYAERLDGGTTANLWLNNDTASIAGGITFGSARDTNLFRNTAGILQQSATIISNRLTVGGSSLNATAIVAAGDSASHSSTATTVYGVYSNYAAPSTATAESDWLYSQIRTAAASFTLTEARGVYVDTPSLGAGSAITSVRGMQIASQAATGITNSYGVSIASGSTYAAKLDGGTVGNLWLNSDTASILGGIAFGTARDVNLYRGSSNTLKTDSNFQTNALGVGQSSTGAKMSATANPSPGGGSSAVVLGALYTAATSNFTTTAQTGDVSLIHLQQQTYTSTPASSIIPDLNALRVKGPAVGANTTATRPAAILVETGTDSNAGLVVRANSGSQSGALQEWQGSSATVLYAITAAGLPKWTAAGNQQTTVGAAGGASAPPASPTKYLKIVDSAGTTLVIPAYAAS